MKEDVTCTFEGCKYKTRAKSTMIIHLATHEGKTETEKPKYDPKSHYLSKSIKGTYINSKTGYNIIHSNASNTLTSFSSKDNNNKEGKFSESTNTQTSGSK